MHTRPIEKTRCTSQKKQRIQCKKDYMPMFISQYSHYEHSDIYPNIGQIYSCLPSSVLSPWVMKYCRTAVCNAFWSSSCLPKWACMTMSAAGNSGWAQNRSPFWPQNQPYTYVRSCCSHTPNTTCNVTRELSWELLQHSAYSLDITTSDYHLFWTMWHFLDRRHFPTQNDVKQALTSLCPGHHISTGMVSNSCSDDGASCGKQWRKHFGLIYACVYYKQHFSVALHLQTFFPTQQNKIYIRNNFAAWGSFLGQYAFTATPISQLVSLNFTAHQVNQTK